MFEDLGIQMNHHSTLISYLEKLVGCCADTSEKKVGNTCQPIAKHCRQWPQLTKSPVVEAPIISGMVPCNVIADEILTDHQDRYRAMLVESANPVHSLADSNRMREALRALELVVVIDIAMTETAREQITYSQHRLSLKSGKPPSSTSNSLRTTSTCENRCSHLWAIHSPRRKYTAAYSRHLAICPRIWSKNCAHSLQKRAAPRSEIGLQRPWRRTVPSPN
ncbi:MAG: hypothetical protein CM15mP103_06430 [Gammaproteobacteria bacterium]|nr:MAG: hypothetical protein CM15mP103_06430 [Gammaproteobacteria bacterium]